MATDKVPMLLLYAACSSEVPPQPHEVVSLSVTPASVTLQTGPYGGDEVQFEAWATLENGETQPLSLVEWSVSNSSAGTIDEAGLFVPSFENGGETWVTARSNGLEAQATAAVIYGDKIVEDGASPSLFTGSVNPLEGAWLYPEDGVNIPRNTPSIEFQWADQGADAYLLELNSAFTNLEIYTTATGWEADEQLWSTIAATNAGGQVEAVLTASVGGALYKADPLTISVNRMDADGSILFWSTSTEGFMEIPYGGESQEFLTINQTGRCMGCHAVSSEGLIAFTYDGGNGGLGVKTLDGLADILQTGATFFGNFKTFSPDSDYLITTYNGALLLYDGRTIEYIGEIATGGYASHIDWSPDGARLALVMQNGDGGDWYFSGGKIAVMDYYGEGQFGAPTVIYDPGSGYNAYYPAWSPDGDWIAFNVSTGDSYDDPDAQVWVISGDGGTPIALEAANQGENLTNSWPRWGPLPDDDVLWLAFASKRPYGYYSDPAVPNPQIWVAGFDPKRAEIEKDPSWPAFWLPDQGVDTNNHIPLWVEMP